MKLNDNVIVAKFITIASEQDAKRNVNWNLSHQLKSVVDYYDNEILASPPCMRQERVEQLYLPLKVTLEIILQGRPKALFQCSIMVHLTTRTPDWLPLYYHSAGTFGGN